MAWTDSHVFRSFLFDALGNTAAYDLDTDVPKAALYGSGSTPDRNDTTAHNVYNGAAGQWVVANELTSSPWVAGGVALSSISYATSSNTITYDAADVAPGGTVTLSGVFGTLVYDDTVGDNGMCFNYFGGSQSVTAGTFTIVWHASGIFTIAV